MSDLVGIPCLFMRGGTSRGPYFRAEDLPADVETRDRVLLAAMGSPDLRQIDGLGGADTLTSKVAIVSKSTRPGVDVDYLFAQVDIARPIVDYLELTQKGNLPLLRPPVRELESSTIQIDAATRRNLELTRSLSGSREGSLLQTIDRTMTAGGGRLAARGTGARGLRGVLESLLQKTMFDLPSHDHVTRCMVDEDAVNGIAVIRVVGDETDASETERRVQS